MSYPRPAEVDTAPQSIDPQLWDIPVDLIDPDPDQPRQAFDPAALDDLAASIRVHGVIQPVEVERTRDGRYRLHHGERRWRASKLAGRTTIPAVVAPPRTREQALVRGLLENLHREELNPIEEGRVFEQLIRMGWSRRRIAQETGRSFPLVSDRLAWMKLEDDIQQLVATGQLHRSGVLAERLRALPPEVRVPLARKLAARGVGLKGSIAAAERAVEKITGRAEAVERGKRMHAERAAAVTGPHAAPMLAHGLNGRGAAPAARTTVRAAAEAMCRECYIRPRGDVLPAWELVEREAAATCADCQRRDGPAVPEVCKNCPGVALVRRLVKGARDG